MVIQRDQPVHIWGHAAPDEAVGVTFRGATQSAKADALGRFSVYLAPGGAGGPFDLTVKGNNTIAFKDILVGDVWIAVMEGEPLPSRTYNHVAFKIEDAEFEAYEAKVKAMGLEIRPPRQRVTGEGRSLYFYDDDNHLFELHTGTLAERLERYAKGKV